MQLPLPSHDLTITEDIFSRCSQFAQNCLGTNANRYARRNQFNPDKIAKDIRNGKIGEEVVHQALISQFPDLTVPDHQIYSAKNKSWDPDLKAGDIRIAVKSQDIDSAISFGESWVFQFREGSNYDVDKGVFGNLDPNHFVSFVALNTPKKKATIRAIVRIDWLHQHKLFKAMKKANLRGNKVAVYWDDLAVFSETDRWQIGK